MKRQTYFLAGALLIAAGLYGCGQNLGQGIDSKSVSVNDIDAQNPVLALEKPFETLGTTDEFVAFDDSDVVGTEEDSSLLSKTAAGRTGDSVTPVPTDNILPVPVPVPPVVIGDPIIIVDPLPHADIDCPRLETYFLKVRWGQIFRDREEIDRDERAGLDLKWMNWSGSLEASSGHLGLVKTILFEKNGGHAPGPDLVHDRVNRKVIAFDSYTKPHYDGLLVKYQHCMRVVDTATDILPMDGTVDAISPVSILPVPDEETITFSAHGLLPRPFSKTWTLRELHKINEVYKDVNANHDSFQIQALRLDDHCPEIHGEIYGLWFKANERFGHIKGRAFSAEGDPVGFIKGFYSVKTNEAGEHKLVAKGIGNDGKFKGILIGTAKDGAFKANIFNLNRVKIGTVTGKYAEGDARRKGTFSAIYALECPVKVVPEPVEPNGPIGGGIPQ